MISPLISSTCANKHSDDKLSLAVSSLTIDNQENSIKISRHRRTPSKQSHDFSTFLPTNMGSNMYEHTTTLRLEEEEEGEPIQKKFHRRTHATDWSELSSISQHRRSLALTKDEFMEIMNMVGDDFQVSFV
jgi:hypothetical protein